MLAAAILALAVLLCVILYNIGRNNGYNAARDKAHTIVSGDISSRTLPHYLGRCTISDTNLENTITPNERTRTGVLEPHMCGSLHLQPHACRAKAAV